MPVVHSMHDDVTTVEAANRYKAAREKFFPEPKKNLAVECRVLTQRNIVLTAENGTLRDEIEHLQVENRSIAQRLVLGEGELPADGYSQIKRKVVTVAHIQYAVCRAFQIRMIDLKSGRRMNPLPQARHVAILLCRTLTSKSFPAIGKEFGGMDHSSALYAFKKYEPLRSDVESLFGSGCTLSELAVKLKDMCQERVNELREHSQAVRTRMGKDETRDRLLRRYATVKQKLAAIGEVVA